MDNHVRAILNANKTFQQANWPLPHDKRREIVEGLVALSPDDRSFIDGLDDGALITLLTLVGSTDTPTEGGHAYLGFMVGFYLRHEQVPS